MYSVVGTDGQVYGPVDVKTIKAWVEEGRVAQMTNLLDPISGRVLRAEDLEELRPLFLTAPPVSGGAPPVIGSQKGAPTDVLTDTPLPTIQQAMPQYAMPQPPPFPQPAMPQMPYTGPLPQVRQNTPVYGTPVPQQGVGAVPASVIAATQVNAHLYPPQTAGGYDPIPTVQVNNVVAVNPATLYPPPQQQIAYAYAPKSKTTAILLCLFLGVLGIHRFYLGRNGSGLAMLLLTVLSFGILTIVTAIWSVIDLILICTGGLRDSYEQPLAG